MKRVLEFALVLSFVIPGHGLSLAKRDTPAVVEAPIQRHRGPRLSLENDKFRRDRMHRRQNAGTVETTLTNNLQAYIINITLGTPARDFRMHIDTGSSDLWVNTPSSPLCTRYSKACSEFGVYTPDESSTYSLVNHGFNITYQDGTGAVGNYVTDTISVGNATLSDFEFGVALQSSTTESVLGIGYSLNEGGAVFGHSGIYQNLPARLASAGIINTNAYSLWLNDLSASTGSIMFGGVNTAKYHSPLHTLSIVPIDNLYSELVVTLTDLGLNEVGSIKSNFKLPVLLDSGTSITYLPIALVRPIFEEYNLEYDERAGAAIVPCSDTSRTDYIVFNFGSAKVRVPFSELVVNLVVTRGSGGTAPAVCAFGIAPLTSGLAVLGDTFLRSAYVVYDLQNNEISLAQTRFGNTAADNVLEITAGENGVPNSKKVGDAPVNPISKDSAPSGSGAATIGAAPFPLWGLLVAGFGTAAATLSI